MITAWLTYSLLVSGLLAVAAWVAERAVRAQGWPGRWPWALAMAGSLGLPLAAWLRPAPEAGPVPSSGLVMPGAYVMEALPVLSTESAAGVLSVEAMVLVGWAAVSATLLLYLAVAAWRVRSEGRRWRRDEVDGVAVLVSRSTGPAALGLVRGWVVLPEWALSLDERLRRLLVLHEAEHVRAGDPQLAVAGLVACALVPWNLPLWWQLGRLRLAIEMDCDARVLRRSGDPASYGSLLVEVGQRRARLAVGLAESRSMLERRIRMITKTTTGRRTLRALGLGTASGLVLAVACETPPPTGLADASSRPQEPGQALSEVRSMDCEPTVYVNGEGPARGDRLAELRPDDIVSVDIFRHRPADARPDDPRCAAVLILTRDASPEQEERWRRARELFGTATRTAQGQAELRDPGDEPTFTPMTVRPRLTNVEEVRQALERHYPPLLRNAGIGGTALVWFLIDAEGGIERLQLNRSSGHDALDQAAFRVARAMEFTPAYLREERVPVWVALPIRFGDEAPAELREAPAELVEAAREPAGAVEVARERRRQEVIRELFDAATRTAQDQGPAFTPMTVRPQLRNAPEVQQTLRDHYPPLLRDAGIGGTANVWVFIDRAGAVQEVRLHQSSGHEALDQGALRVAARMQFEPARNRDEVVPVWVVLPITFDAARTRRPEDEAR
jgi:TonB family protein